MSGFLADPIFTGLQQVLDLRHQQHALTASNLANSDTPGFKAQVIDFSTVLEGLFGTTAQVKRTRAQHLGGVNATNVSVDQIEAPPWSVDGNSVVPERETARLRQNSLMYSAVSTGLSRRLAMLKYAANDGKF